MLKQPKKRAKNFFLARSNFFIHFLSRSALLLNHFGSDPKIRGGIPQNTSQPDGPFWPFEHKNSPGFRGIFAMASFKMRKPGTPEGIRTPDLLVRSQTLYPAELLALVSAFVLYLYFPLLSRVCGNFFMKFQQGTAIWPQNRHLTQGFSHNRLGSGKI